MKKIGSIVAAGAILVSGLFSFSAFSQVPSVDAGRSLKVPFKTPVGLAYDGAAFWVGDLASGKIAKIDPDSGTVLSSVDAPCFTVGSLAYDGKLLWILDPTEKTVHGFDPASGKTMKTMTLDLQTPQGIACDGNDIWVSDGGDGVIVKIDGGDGTTYASVPAPSANSGRRSQLAALCFHDSFLWTADRLSDTLYQLEPARGYVLNLLKSPGPYTAGIAFCKEGMACLDYEKREIAMVRLPDHGAPSRFNPREENMTFGETYRNFGPGNVEELSINIAVPVDLPYQQLTSPVKWNPEPSAIKKDRWGQEVAVYSFRDLKPQGVVSAGFTVSATLHGVRFFIDPRKTGTIEDMPSAVRTQYLKDDSKLQTGSPVILKAVKEAVGDETNCYYMVRKIYQYIHEKMHYELVGGWNVAPVVLERGSGSCSEYSFVMISMCRAAGIPARYAGSIVVRGDNASRDDVFHRWVEVWLPSVGWVPVDPSGGDSKVPEDQAKGFAGLDNRFLITTVGGGSSEYLNWDYNSSSSYTARGPVKLNVLKAGDWSPTSGSRNEELPLGSKKPGTCGF